MGDGIDSGSYGAQAYLEFGRGRPRLGVQGYFASQPNSPDQPTWQSSAGVDYTAKSGLNGYAQIEGSRNTPTSESTFQAKAQASDVLGDRPELSIEGNYRYREQGPNFNMEYGASGQLKANPQSGVRYQAQGDFRAEQPNLGRSVAVNAQVAGQSGEPPRLDVLGHAKDAQLMGGPAQAGFHYQRNGNQDSSLAAYADATPQVGGQPVRLTAHHQQIQQPHQPAQSLSQVQVQGQQFQGQGTLQRSGDQWQLHSQGQANVGPVHARGQLDANNQQFSLQGQAKPIWGENRPTQPQPITPRAQNPSQPSAPKPKPPASPINRVFKKFGPGR